ncbi:O-antigen ligase family protein [Lacisediminihabitans changchengi]|uniref:O-antigen ligase family protein n=1 Tax=Lacisediminihabitans changchengi TaxID=2787634 RepID=A0A934W3E8_9MICO|nr:O-antigen ligase family protein [Lacisediminihabitans changchengi]MBK4346440.1 O-antigen ligase family protein [Lacisediminihabitans changchengi]
MTQALVAIGALATIALIFSSREYRSGWGPALRRIPLLVYPAAAGVWPIIATIFGYYLKDANRPLRTEQLFAFQFAPLLLVSVIVAVIAMVRGFQFVLLPTFALVAILLAEAVGALVLGQSWGHVLAATAALAPALFVRREGGQLDILKRGVTLALALLVLVLAVFVFVKPELALRPCAQSFKCLLSDRALTVDFGAGSNVTGVTLALIAPAVVYTIKGWRAWILPLPVLMIVMLSGSRTAMVAVVLGSVLSLFLRIDWFGRRPWVLAAPVLLVSLIPAFVAFPHAAFTNRGNLWGLARGLIEQSPLFGQGASFWIRNSGPINNGLTSYSPHNLWLGLAVDIGIVGVIAVIAATVAGYITSSKAGRGYAWPFIFAMLSAGILEATVLYQRLSPFPVGLLMALTALAIGYADRKLPAEPDVSTNGPTERTTPAPIDGPTAEELLRPRN